MKAKGGAAKAMVEQAIAAASTVERIRILRIGEVLGGVEE